MEQPTAAPPRIAAERQRLHQRRPQRPTPSTQPGQTHCHPANAVPQRNGAIPPQRRNPQTRPAPGPAWAKATAPDLAPGVFKQSEIRRDPTADRELNKYPPRSRSRRWPAKSPAALPWQGPSAADCHPGRRCQHQKQPIEMGEASEGSGHPIGNRPLRPPPPPGQGHQQHQQGIALPSMAKRTGYGLQKARTIDNANTCWRCGPSAMASACATITAPPAR